jgi:hypothetical protein
MYTGTITGLTSAYDVLLTLPLTPKDRTVFIDFYVYEISTYESRGGSLTLIPTLDYSSVSIIDNASGSLNFGYGAGMTNSSIVLVYGVGYGEWTFDYAITILSTPIVAAPLNYGLSVYGGSPLITHYTQVQVNSGECLCGDDNVKYESFGIIGTIGGLTQVGGYKLNDCTDGCP